MIKISSITMVSSALFCSCSSGVSFDNFDKLSKDHCECVSNLSGMAEHENGCKTEYEAWSAENSKLAEQINEVAPNDEELMNQYHNKQNEHTDCHMAAIQALMEKDGE